MAVTAGTARGQVLRQDEPSPLVRADYVPTNDMSEMQQRMAKQANLEREKQMKADTEKLFKLAQELKESVGKTNADILSLDVMKKANEIEKLAHSVKQKMRGPN
jgi:spore coat polysaccharide biosynthesis protein SpsF (cytidylyltransferase family)